MTELAYQLFAKLAWLFLIVYTLPLNLEIIIFGVHIREDKRRKRSESLKGSCKFCLRLGLWGLVARSLLECTCLCSLKVAFGCMKFFSLIHFSVVVYD